MQAGPDIANLPDSDSVRNLLFRCGAKLLDLYRSGNTDGEWQGEQYKDEADSIAHRILVEGLLIEFPDIAVVSEEDERNTAEAGDEYFIVDPIDGTASFAHGFAGWVTQIAYVRQQVPVMAGIYAPVSGEYFEAVRGRGAYCNARRLQVGADRRAVKTIIDNYPEPRGFASEAMAGLGIKRYIESGSIALKICRVADGSADLFLKDMTPRDWDLAAPMLVLEEAGGCLTDLDGRSPRLGMPGRRHNGLIAAGNAALLDEVKAWLASRK